MAILLVDGAPLRICAPCWLTRWSQDARFLFVFLWRGRREPVRGETLAIPSVRGKPADLPVGGIAPLADPSVVHGAESVGRGALVSGKDPAHYAWVNTTVHRNLYRISLP